MIRPADNPFRQNKLEFEDRPVIWLSKQAKGVIAGRRSVYVAGSRGCGKSTVLRSLATKHILMDIGLRTQFQKPPGWFGVFVQLNETFPEIVDTACSRYIRNADLKPDELQSRRFLVFSHFLEMQIAEKTFDDICALHDEGLIFFDANAEISVIKSISSGIFYFLSFCPSEQSMYTFHNFKKYLKRYNEVMFNEFFYGDAIGRPFIVTPGSIIQCLSKEVVPIVHSNNLSRDDTTIFKIMIDDCELLDAEQQIFLNSLIRKVRQPVMWVAAYVDGFFNPVDTVLNNMSMIGDDRQILRIDRQKPAEFQNFCCHVASLRLYYSVGKLNNPNLNSNPMNYFDLRSRLGHLPLNKIISHYVRRSLSTEATRLQKIAKLAHQLISDIIPKSEHERYEIRPSALPYYQAIRIEEILKDHLEEKNTNLYEIFSGVNNKSDNYRLIKSRLQSISKYQVVSFLEICRRLDLESIPYIGFGIITALSDSCIRDFLDIFGEIYEEIIVQATSDGGGAILPRALKFCESKDPIDFDVQRRAVHRAAYKKLDSIETISKPTHARTSKVIQAIGHLVHGIERPTDDVPQREAGLIEVDIADLRSAAEALRGDPEVATELFRMAERHGFIRRPDDKAAAGKDVSSGGKLRFHLHRRLAPVFDLSFRMPPREPFRIPSVAMYELIFSPEPPDPEMWAREVLARSSHSKRSDDPRQNSLPISEDGN